MISEGFIEVMNRIIKKCRCSDDCRDCPFLVVHTKYTECYFQKLPETYESLDILRMSQEEKNGGGY